MSVKVLSGKTKSVEILTNEHEIYVQKEKDGFVFDYFKSKVKNNDAAHEGGDLYEDFEELEAALKDLDVADADIAELKRIYGLT